MKIEHLSGLIAAPFTPMSEDGSLKLSVIPHYYELLKANGVRGAFICGSTGEGVSMTVKEKKLVAEAWGSSARHDSDFLIITLVGGTSITECIELATHAKSAGLYGVAMTSPFYFKPVNVDVLADVCFTVANIIPEVPFYYYHIPVLTGVNFPMLELLKRLDNRLPNFVGIKYTHEDFMDFLSCIHFNNGKYDMLWGRDESLLAALTMGAKGGVGSTYNYAAPLYHELIAAYKQGDFELARAKQQQSIDIITLLTKYGGISAGKSYMKLIGLDCGEFRLPVKNMTGSQFELFKNDVTQIKFDSFCCRLPSH